MYFGVSATVDNLKDYESMLHRVSTEDLVSEFHDLVKISNLDLENSFFAEIFDFCYCVILEEIAYRFEKEFINS